MPFTNFDNRHFTATEKTAINAALTTLETAFSSKSAELTGEEKQQFGSINEINKLIVNKVKEYRDSQPALSSPDVDWTEFLNDFDTRTFLNATLNRLEGMATGLDNARILHDNDNYQASLNDYEFSKYKASSNITGFRAKIDDIAQLFPASGTKRNKGNSDATA